MRTTFVNTLLELAEKNDRIFLLTPDMGFSVLEPFREKFPDRFLNTGIAEQNPSAVASMGVLEYMHINRESNGN